MTNIFRSPEKVERKKRLLEIGVETLKGLGYGVEKVRGRGSSVRRITKDGVTQRVAIRTTQDQWISFPRLNQSGEWRTLSEVDLVVAVSVDDKDNPRFGLVHMFDQADIKQRFDRGYDARVAAGHSDPAGHGMWVSLYDQEARNPVQLIGAGAGLESPPIARVPMDREGTPGGPAPAVPTPSLPCDQRPLTIAEAKRRLALTLGVDPSAIKITVEA